MRPSRPDTAILPGHSALIANRLAAGDGDVVAHVYPATGEATGDVRLASGAQLDEAVAAARAAFPSWRAMPGDRRRDLLLRLAAAIEADSERLARLCVIENGMVAALTPYSVADAAQKFRYFGGWADKIEGRTIATWGGPAHDHVAFEPYGVIGAIVPWNGPLYATTMVIAPALAAGNCVVVKAPDVAPYAVLRLAELFVIAGFPPGVVNVVAGGGDTGAAMVAHPGIDKIQFVGSGATARNVLAAAADTLKPCGLELGGKSAVIVFADADFEGAVQRGISGAVAANGQGCVNGTRLLVERSIYGRYTDALGTLAGYITPGDPLDPQTRLGPVISRPALDGMVGRIDDALAAGGRLVSGGARAGGDLAEGYFLPITIVADVANDSGLAQHEVFGPVLSITPFDDEDEAVALANGTPYGLGGYVHTQDLRRAHHVASALDAGMVHVNGAGEAMTPCTPFGGMKQSGYGRLGGREGLFEFLRVKNVWINLVPPASA